jgi:ankyrin repeat protein
MAKRIKILRSAAKGGHKEAVAILIDKPEPEQIGLLGKFKQNYYGWRPLHLAAWQGHAETVGLLIEQLEDIETEIDPESKAAPPEFWRDAYYSRLERPKWRALHLAAHEGHAQVIQQLVEKGAERREKVTYADHDQTPLQLAVQGIVEARAQLAIDVEIYAQQDDLGMAEILTQGAQGNFETREKERLAALEVLIETDWDDRVRLFDKIADDWKIALESAATAGHGGAVAVFFEKLIGKGHEEFLDRVLLPGLLAAANEDKKEIILLFMKMALKKELGRKDECWDGMAERLLSILKQDNPPEIKALIKAAPGMDVDIFLHRLSSFDRPPTGQRLS